MGDAGEITSWAWVAEPLESQPLGRPFAFALIKLDGADTPMVHAVDTGGDPAAVRTGLRVKARWRPVRPADVEADAIAPDGGRYREGHILDIECFEPEEAAS